METKKQAQVAEEEMNISEQDHVKIVGEVIEKWRGYLEAKDQEIARLQAYIGELEKRWPCYNKIAAQAKALAKYGNHLPLCGIYLKPPAGCTCGWGDFLFSHRMDEK